MSDTGEKPPRRLSYFWKRGDLGKRLLIAGTILLALTIFLHLKEAKVELLRLDLPAKEYVVAQVDFSFPDQEGTLILRHESTRDIGSIYRLSEKEIKKRQDEVSEEFIESQSWRAELPYTTFEQLQETLDALRSELLKAHFSDRRTVAKLQQLGLETGQYFVLEQKVDEPLILPDSFWQKIRDKLTSLHYPKAVATYEVAFFEKEPWQLKDDIVAQSSIRKVVEEGIPEKLTHIQAGSRIVDKEEIVTERHIAMVQAMKEAIDKHHNRWQPLTVLSSFLFALILVFIGYGYFSMTRKSVITSLTKLGLYATILILTLIFAKGAEYFLLRSPSDIFDVVRYPLFIPFAAILLVVLIGAEEALFTVFLLSLVMGQTLAVDQTRFLVINVVTGIVAILSARLLRRRMEVFTVCAKVWLCTIPVLLIFLFLHNTFFNAGLIVDLTSSFAFMVLTAVLIVGLLPILESLFHIMTDITLMEYMDPNSELLRRLSIEAPGTYQHSLVVGSLAEAAAQSIGANGLFCRVATLYHDIGKLSNPHYFTENQLGGFNIHGLLTPMESAQVIIDHVTDGEELARSHGLPQSFIDIIREHHGTTLVYYFYAKQVEQMEGDVDKVEQEQFQYPGPKPRTKESAIIMIADSMEAASRSLDEVSEESLTELLDRLVIEKEEEGQLDNCLLTFEELGKVKRSIIKTISVTRHMRIKYPKKI